ncbi:selenide, water dikinase SelD [Parasulfuritortus cantonensis]|uniref:Selenide, water dikinase n=1 Tax=Parasulfuritortus cantonensis TaxID=2528202 RepID=A0A4V2NVC9_9PROT|nr:selenide, water dikinase SelD [Parasulfuritortus cantonensis]TCJ12976.1 selenide, water dikinase SelD [Parasulfuritortus cantonensis]
MSEPALNPPVRLTHLSHGGGCGCKIAPAVLEKILADTPFSKGILSQFPDLLVGIESSDDAAVWQLNDEQAIVATTDFFMPIVDDPYEFGRIAATNAISDVYAMGGKPLFALALVGMPIDKLSHDTIRQILSGGDAAARAAGIPIAGGHSIDSQEPIYGLVAIGVVNPKQVKKNNAARPGDVLILGKGLGVGIYSAALKKDKLPEDGYRAMIASTTQLNTPGTELGGMDAVHGLTDVTGFALLGHALELARGSGLRARVEFARLPVLPFVAELAQAGFVTGASGRNWASYGGSVELFDGCSDWQRAILTDPQTSGGLLVACAPEAEAEVMALFARHGFGQAAVIGRLETGPAGVVVTG